MSPFGLIATLETRVVFLVGFARLASLREETLELCEGAALEVLEEEGFFLASLILCHLLALSVSTPTRRVELTDSRVRPALRKNS